MVADVGSLGKTTTHGYRREPLGEDRDRKLWLGWEGGGKKGEESGEALHSRHPILLPIHRPGPWEKA